MNEKIIGLIPARSGSKGINNKNISPLLEYPLIAYSIIASKMSNIINRTIVSTDSEIYYNIALRYGAEVPFLRPKQISKSDSLDIEYIQHCIEWLQEKEGFQPDYIVILAPTVPLRDPQLIDEAIQKIQKNNDATSLRSGHEIRESPYKLFGLKNEYFVGLFPDDSRKEYYNLPRQVFPPIYQPNSYVDIIKVKTLDNTDTLHGSRILSFITPDVGEVDRIEDIEYINYKLSTTNNPVYENLKRNYSNKAIIKDD